MTTSGTSEWGKLQLGQHYQVIALDVFRALAVAGLNKYEWIVIQHVMEQSWYTSFRSKDGKEYPEPIACPLNVSSLAKAIEGKDAPHAKVEKTRKLLSDAKASLAAKRIAMESDGRWTPNKDADSWVVAGTETALLSPAQRDYAASIQTRRNGFKPAPEVVVTPPPNGGGRNDQINTPPRPQMGAVSAPIQGHHPAPIQGHLPPPNGGTPHIAERGRGDLEISIQMETAAAPDAPLGKTDREPDDISEARREAAAVAILKASPGASSEMLDDLIGYCELKSRPTDPPELAAQMIAVHSRRFGFFAVQAAVAKVMGMGGVGDLWAYVKGALEGFERDGKTFGPKSDMPSERNTTPIPPRFVRDPSDPPKRMRWLGDPDKKPPGWTGEYRYASTPGGVS